MKHINNRCFGCGPANPHGLHLKFLADGELYYTECVPDERYQGYPGVLHGGIVSTILDEVMVNHLCEHGFIAMTVELRVRYKKPVPTGKRLKFVSRVKRLSHRLGELEAWVRTPDGELLVTAEAKMMRAVY